LRSRGGLLRRVTVRGRCGRIPTLLGLWGIVRSWIALRCRVPMRSWRVGVVMGVAIRLRSRWVRVIRHRRVAAIPLRRWWLTITTTMT
jgi:hypothetical protein